MTLTSFGIGGIPPRPSTTTGSAWMRADVNEIIIVPGLLGNDDRQTMEGYLAHKWGFAANLPAGHPYKEAAPSSIGAMATLEGTVGNPSGTPLTITWAVVSGPAAVTFADASAPDTTASFSSTGTYVLRLTASDDFDSVHDEVTITVESVPIAEDQSVMTHVDTPIDITLTATDSSDAPLTYSIVNPPANGTLSGIPPDLTYTPNSGFTGEDSFTFKVNDGGQESNVATVSIAVIPHPSASGGTVELVGDYYMHTFTDGTDAFEVSDGIALEVDVLVVGGGGGGGMDRDSGGGGGAGGLVFVPAKVVSGAVAVEVGAGGVAFLGSGTSHGVGGNGGNSVFGDLVALGGGGGGTRSGGLDGGSGGGGGAGTITDTTSSGGSGVQSSEAGDSGAFGFGNGGGIGSSRSTRENSSSGGGGGAGAAGVNAATSSPWAAGKGGDGLHEVTLNGASYNFADLFGTQYGHILDGEAWFAGGGGGGSRENGSFGAGGNGGGGGGGKATGNENGSGSGTNGLANTGGGGGGAGTRGTGGASGSGGSGIVIVRYLAVSPGDGPSDPFNEWAANGDGGGEVTFTGDSNGDGVADGMSWLLGAANPAQNANGLLPEAAETNGDLVLSFKMLNSSQRGAAVLRLERSSDLGLSDPWMENSITVPDESGTVGGVDFEVTPIEGTNLNEVVVTIPASVANGTGKLFVRLSGALSP